MKGSDMGKFLIVVKSDDVTPGVVAAVKKHFASTGIQAAVLGMGHDDIVETGVLSEAGVRQLKSELGDLAVYNLKEGDTISFTKLDEKRQAAYDAIDSERDYQERRWGPAASNGRHSVTEFLAYMQDYLTEALHQVSRGSDPEASQQALNTLRKVTAMGVACMEQHGAPKREG